MNNRQQTFGIGIEMEGFLLNKEGKPQETLQGQPTSEWIIQQVQKKYPQLTPFLSVEQASVMLEVKSEVEIDEAICIRQILEIRDLIDGILEPFGIKFIFTPVAEKPFQFIAASSDRNSRTHELIKAWGKDSNGETKLFSTVTAGLQINHSEIFRSTSNDQEKLELSRFIHNGFSKEFDNLVKLNRNKKAFNGKTRLEIARWLLQTLKKTQFEKKGFTNPTEILVPPHFENIERLKHWICAHSDVDDFNDANCKNEHAHTCKIKRNDFWAVESRYADAVNTEREIKQIIQADQGVLKKALEHFQLYSF